MNCAVTCTNGSGPDARSARSVESKVSGAAGSPGWSTSANDQPRSTDRAVPGHWEGDLIMGSTASKSAIGTLVERASRFVMLLHLPDGHGADAVDEAMIETMSQLPETLRRTLTWDQGHEMTITPRDRCRDRPGHLLLRPPLALAARQQREHQRPAAPVLPQGHRPVGLPARLPRPRRRQAQPQTPQDPRLEDTGTGPRRTTVEPTKTNRCCIHRLNPPPAECGWRTAGGLGAPGGIRTHTGWCLRPLPLPLGYRGESAYGTLSELALPS